MADKGEENEDYKIDKNEDDETIYQCKVCDVNYKTKQGVRQHISKKHKKKTAELDVDEIEKEIEAELNGESADVDIPFGNGLQLKDFEFHPPSSQADFDLNVTKLFENHEQEKNCQTSPVLSTPKTVSWRNKFEEKENELTLATVKLTNIEQKLREKDNELGAKDEMIENFVKTESEHAEKIRELESELKEKDDLLQTAIAQVESNDCGTKSNDDESKEKDMKIARYGKYISQLVSEIRSLKNKQPESNPTSTPANEAVAKLSKENEDLHVKVKKVSDEMKSGKSALKKVEENNALLAKSIRDLQEKLNIEKNKASKVEVEKHRLERNSDRLAEIIEINDDKKESKERTPKKKIVEEKCRFYEANGWCRFDKECHNLHPSRYCEWYQKVGKCPVENCKDLHSQRECPFWNRGYCKNDRCRMKHDPKLKGSSKRERSPSPPQKSTEKRMKLFPDEEKKTDVYYSNTIEERFNKQAEQNHFLAKSLAGLSAEVRNLSSQQVPYPPLAPTQAADQPWTQAAPRIIPPVFGAPVRHHVTPLAPQAQPQPFYNQYQ